MKQILSFSTAFLISIFVLFGTIQAQGILDSKEKHIGLIEINTAILPGTSEYFKRAVAKAENNNSEALIVKINTPGGMLISTQEIIQTIFKSKIPIIMYVSPSGGTAASAGVFITMAGHIAAMAPGTSIGAAHPVESTGKDIDGDMRKKVENLTVAMVRSIAEERKRDTSWVEKAIRDSSSLTEKEALKQHVIDLVAPDDVTLLQQIKGKEIKIDGRSVILGDYSSNIIDRYLPTLREQTINLFADPSVVALLWLGATAGIGAELYHPGLIFPGVFGAICLILALMVTTVLPLSQGAILLIVLGGLLIGAELYVTSGILAIGGLVSIVLGLVTLVDVSRTPDLRVALELLIPVAVVGAAAILFVIYQIAKTRKLPAKYTGFEEVIGKEGKAMTVFDEITKQGKVYVNGEVWTAVAQEGIISEGDNIVIIGKGEQGLTLKVKKP